MQEEGGCARRVRGPSLCRYVARGMNVHVGTIWVYRRTAGLPRSPAELKTVSLLPTRHAVSNSACSLYSVCALVIIALRIQPAAALFIILAAYYSISALSLSPPFHSFLMGLDSLNSCRRRVAVQEGKRAEPLLSLHDKIPGKPTTLVIIVRNYVLWYLEL